MLNIFRTWLPTAAVAIALTGLATTSQAAWPLYRVNAGYSLPSAPALRPKFVPVYPTQQYLQANPTPLPAAYAAPAVSVPGYVPQGVAPANLAPSLTAPPVISVPNNTYYPPAYGQPAYNPPTYPAPATSYYPPPASYSPTTSYYPQTTVPQPTYQPYHYQQPRPIQPYVQPVQPAGGYYQPTRPSTFYSPTPSYYPQQPVFGQY